MAPRILFVVYPVALSVELPEGELHESVDVVYRGSVYTPRSNDTSGI
jgi:hypothetical protein